MIEDITEDHEGPDDPYNWGYYLGLAAGFIHRVSRLEADGRHPLIMVSW